MRYRVKTSKIVEVVVEVDASSEEDAIEKAENLECEIRELKHPWQSKINALVVEGEGATLHCVDGTVQWEDCWEIERL